MKDGIIVGPGGVARPRARAVHEWLRSCGLKVATTWPPGQLFGRHGRGKPRPTAIERTANGMISHTFTSSVGLGGSESRQPLGV